MRANTATTTGNWQTFHGRPKKYGGLVDQLFEGECDTGFPVTRFHQRGQEVALVTRFAALESFIARANHRFDLLANLCRSHARTTHEQRLEQPDQWLGRDEQRNVRGRVLVAVEGVKDRLGFLPLQWHRKYRAKDDISGKVRRLDVHVM